MWNNRHRRHSPTSEPDNDDDELDDCASPPNKKRNYFRRPSTATDALSTTTTITSSSTLVDESIGADRWLQWKNFETTDQFEQWFQATCRSQFVKGITKRINNFGEKLYYHCANRRKLGWQTCHRRICVTYFYDSDDIFVEHNNKSHEHCKLMPSPSSIDHNTNNHNSRVIIGNDINHSNGITSPSSSSPISMIKSKRSIAENSKAVIIEGIHEALPSNQIIRRLKHLGLNVPSKSQLNSFIQWYTKKVYGKQEFTLADLIDYSSSRTGISTDNANRPYILSFFVECNENGKLGFQIVWSTANMLRTQSKSLLLQVDTQCRLAWQGYPVLVLGTSDENHHFYPTCVTLTSSIDDASAFHSLFSTLKSAISSINPHYYPKVILANESSAISNAAREIFPRALRATCSVSALKQIDRKLVELGIAKKLRNRLRDDINLIAQSESAQQFNGAVRLASVDWTQISDDSSDQSMSQFADYFRKSWTIGDSTGWYEGFQPYTSSNGALESLLKSVADTLATTTTSPPRERLPYRQYFAFIEQIVSSWSATKNYKTFAVQKPTPTNIVDGWQWNVLGKQVIKIIADENGDDVDMLLTTADDIDDQSMQLSRLAVNYQSIADGGEVDCKCWNTYKQHRFGVVAMRRRSSSLIASSVDDKDLSNNNEKHHSIDRDAPPPSPPMMVYTCNCSIGIRKRICKHVIGYRIRLDEIAVPAHLSAVSTVTDRPTRINENGITPSSIILKRKRGRPRKVTLTPPSFTDDQLLLPPLTATII